MKKIFLAIVSILFSFCIVAGAEAATLTDVSWASRTDAQTPFVRIVLSLSAPAKAEASLKNEGKTLSVKLKDSVLSDSVSSSYSVSKQNVGTVFLSSTAGDIQIETTLNQSLTAADIKIFPLKPDTKAGRPQRLVIDIPSKGTASPSKETTVATNASAKTTTVSQTKSTSTSYTADATAKKYLKNKIICIDPGHGGADVGAISSLGGETIYEKDITMAISKPLSEMLKAAGAKVVMTHATDKDVYGAYADDATELQARCDIGNKAKADIFISVHIDSFANTSVDGTTVYYYPKSSKDLLLAKRVHSAILNNLAIPDRGVRSNELYVNVHTKMPSILVEMGFFSNTHRLKMLTSTWGTKSIAQSLYKGIIDYFKQIS